MTTTLTTTLSTGMTTSTTTSIMTDPTTTTKMTEKNVLVLSTKTGKPNQPMIISFNGDYKEASFQFGPDTEVEYSCSLEFKNQFYVFGGKNIKNQVNK